MLALWAVPVSFARDPSVLVLLLGGLAYLLLLTAGRPRTGAAGPPPWRDPASLPLAATVTVLAVALGPVASATGLYGSVRLPGQGVGPGSGPVSVSLDLDMRASLTERTPRAPRHEAIPPKSRSSTPNPRCRLACAVSSPSSCSM